VRASELERGAPSCFFTFRPPSFFLLLFRKKKTRSRLLLSPPILSPAMASTAPAPSSSQAQAATLALASSMGLSLRADWLEAVARAGAGTNPSASSMSMMASPPMTAEALVSLVLNADLNSAGGGGALPADLEVSRTEGKKGAIQRRKEWFFSLSCFFLLSAGRNRKLSTSSTSSSQPPKLRQPFHGRALTGRRIVQVDEVVNAAASSKHR